jgi:hypothetical protein
MTLTDNQTIVLSNDGKTMVVQELSFCGTYLLTKKVDIKTQAWGIIRTELYLGL